MPVPRPPMPKPVQYAQFALVMSTLFILWSYAELYPFFSVAFMIVAALVNLAMVGLVRWWRSGKNKVEKIFDEELG